VAKRHASLLFFRILKCAQMTEDHLAGNQPENPLTSRTIREGEAGKLTGVVTADHLDHGGDSAGRASAPESPAYERPPIWEIPVYTVLYAPSRLWDMTHKR
jgi:hypothetical protein